MAHHGSPHNTIKEFSPTEAGIFTSPDPQFANNYANMNLPSGREKGTMYPVKIRTDRPFDFKDKEQVDALINTVKENPVERGMFDYRPDTDRRHIETGDWMTMEAPEVQKSLKQLGHDSYKVAEEIGPELGATPVPRTINTAVYDPSQIRSKFAAFDPYFKTSGNILAGGAGAAAILAGSNNAEASVDPKKPAVNLAPEELAKLTAYKKFLDDGGRRGEINRYLNQQKEIGDKMMDLEARPIWESRTPEEEAFYEENRRNPFFEGTQIGMNAAGTVKSIGRAAENVYPKLKTLFQAGSGEILHGNNAAEALNSLRAQELGSVMTRTTPESIGSVMVKEAPKVKPGKVIIKD